jgi:beta-phosphoglucomutase-like phosphatase (HAD superfamily)
LEVSTRRSGQLEGAGFPVVAAASFPRLLPWELKQRILGRRGSEFSPIVVEFAEREWPGGSITPDALWADWERHLDALLEAPGADLCAGAGALVGRLAAAGVRMGINTSSKASAVAHKRKRHELTLFGCAPVVDRARHLPCPEQAGIISSRHALARRPDPRFRRHMSCVVTGDEVSQGKPAPESFLEAARRLAADPRVCIAFEDSLPGVQSAVAAGMKVYAVPDARLSEPGNTTPLYYVPTL